MRVYLPLIAAALLSTMHANAQTSAFTYQGRLNDADVSASGTYEMRFTLRDAAVAGNAVPIAPILTQAVDVTNGWFTVALDFGGAPMDGSPRWLEIAVRTNGSVLPLSTLSPRQPIHSAPYALRAGTVSNFTNGITDAQLSTNIARLNGSPSFNTAVTFSSTTGAPFNVNTTNRVNNLNADLLDGFSSAAFWNVSGNSLTAATNFVGTTDNQPLNFRVNNARALRLESGGGAPNIIGGHGSNFITTGIGGATISGGGTNGFTNRITAGYATIGGGLSNSVSGTESFIGGGFANVIQTNSERATISGGRLNNILLDADYTSIVGGERNTINTNGHYSVIAGGATNTAAGAFTVISGGSSNTVRGAASTVGGGQQNAATTNFATVAGGYNNTAAGISSFAAGQRARALHNGSFVWADSSTSTSFLDTTADNQFVVRAAGGVGIGGAPQDAMLDVEGSVRLNDEELYIRGASDRNHGLGYYGGTKLFNGVNIDGPVLYGWSGGALATMNGSNLALRWTSGGDVGIGRAPGTRLDVSGPGQFIGRFEGSHSGGTWLALANTSVGGGSWNLISSGSGNGEGAGQLLFFGGGSTKVTFRDNGYVGIGTTTPGERLEVSGPDTTLRIRNTSDTGGGFIGNTWSALHLGLYNPSTTAAFGVVPASTKRSFFGFDSSGKVGSLLNNYGQPIYRNLLDDGNGNMSTAGALNFGSTTRQMVNLYSSSYGIGVQANTFYSRSDGNFAWYRDGIHSNNGYDAGAGGSTLMKLDSGGLTVNGTFFSASDRTRKENFAKIKSRDVLNKLVALPIEKWNYKESAGVQHIGPTAQDFHAAFGVGPDDKHISMVDADGVSFAAIQGLHQLVQEQDAEIKGLRNSVDELKKLVERLAAERK